MKKSATYPTGWDIQITPAGPDSPIYKGGLRMNSIQRPAKPSSVSGNNAAEATKAAQDSHSPLSENTNQPTSKGGK